MSTTNVLLGNCTVCMFTTTRSKLRVGVPKIILMLITVTCDTTHDVYYSFCHLNVCEDGTYQVYAKALSKWNIQNVSEKYTVKRPEIHKDVKIGPQVKTGTILYHAISLVCEQSRMKVLN